MQQVISGINCLDGLADLTNSKGKKILVAAGKHVLKEEWFQHFLSSIKGEKELIHSPAGLLEVSDIYTIDIPDVLVAIGGGKTIDFAKVLLKSTKQPNEIFFIAAPTTAGSGSEATPFAVVYSGKEKQTIDDTLLLPDAVFLDSSLLKNLSSQQKAISGADAFSQCIESLWNIHCANESEQFAVNGLEVLLKHLPAFVKGVDEVSGQKILEAAHQSGKAIAITRTTGAHALSYYLTAHHNVPHGQAVALFLPIFFLYNQAKINQTIYKALHVSNAEEAFIATRIFFKEIGLATHFSELEVSDISVDALLHSVNHHRFSNNPVPYNEDLLRSLIHQHLL